MKLRRTEVIELDNVLTGLKRIRDTRFAYAVAKNRQALKPEVDCIKDAQEPSDNIKEFDQCRFKLVTEYAARDANSQFIEAGPGQVKIEPDKLVDFNNAVKKLTKEFGIAEELAKKDKEVRSLLSEEVEITFYPIKAEAFPSEISSDEMLLLMPLIEGDLEAVLADRAAKK